MVTLTAGITTGSSGTLCFMSFAATGGNTVAVSDTRSVSADRTAGPHMSATYFLTGLTAGSTTFTSKYKSGSSGTSCTFVDRNIIVIPY
jgi:hypothetical protein